MNTQHINCTLHILNITCEKQWRKRLTKTAIHVQLVRWTFFVHFKVWCLFSCRLRTWISKWWALPTINLQMVWWVFNALHLSNSVFNGQVCLHIESQSSQDNHISALVVPQLTQCIYVSFPFIHVFHIIYQPMKSQKLKWLWECHTVPLNLPSKLSYDHLVKVTLIQYLIWCNMKNYEF